MTKRFFWKDTGIQIYRVSGEIFINGNTFPIKDSLKRLGFRWHGPSKSWYIEASKLDHAKTKLLSRQLEDLRYQDIVNLDELNNHLPPMSRIQEKTVPPQDRAATPNQVKYALALLHRLGRYGWHDSDMGQGSSMPTENDLKGMTVKEISQLIDGLRYELG